MFFFAFIRFNIQNLIKYSCATILYIDGPKNARMDGYTATKKIREFNKGVVIIAQTAYAQEDDTEMALNIGCNDLITKPIDIERLLKMTRKHLRLEE